MEVPREAVEKAVTTNEDNLDAILEWLECLNFSMQKYVWRSFTHNTQEKLLNRSRTSGVSKRRYMVGP